MLEIKGLYKTFNPGTVNEKRALNRVNLTMESGDFITVIGGNGAGKSTLMNAIAGTWPVDEGAIIIDGINVTNLNTVAGDSYTDRSWMPTADWMARLLGD